jgi:hypothetical protein
LLGGARLLLRSGGLRLGLRQLRLHRVQLLLHGANLLLQLRVVGEGRHGDQERRPEHRASQQHTQSSFDDHLDPPLTLKIHPQAGLFFGDDNAMTKVPRPPIRRLFTANRPAAWHICHIGYRDVIRAKS